MSAPSPSKNLQEYQAWRQSIVPLEPGSIIAFNVEYAPLTTVEHILPGQYFKVIQLWKGFLPIDDLPAAKTYELELCSREGTLFGKKKFWLVETIAEYIADNKISVIG